MKENDLNNHSLSVLHERKNVLLKNMTLPQFYQPTPLINNDNSPNKGSGELRKIVFEVIQLSYT